MAQNVFFTLKSLPVTTLKLHLSKFDFLKSPSSCLFRTRRTKDFSYYRSLGFNQSEVPWISHGDPIVNYAHRNEISTFLSVIVCMQCLLIRLILIVFLFVHLSSFVASSNRNEDSIEFDL